MASQVGQTIETIWRMESAKIIAALTRRVGDVGLAEDLAQDALVIALEKWPQAGIPNNPAAWLMATAKHRAIDRLRHFAMADGKHAQLARDLEAEQAATGDFVEAAGKWMGDDLLRLIFIACHPVLSVEAQMALTLRLLGGLTTGEIARAFLTPEPTIAQRITRAKRTLSEAAVPFELPTDAERSQRLSTVLSVLYLIFNEGYSATAGEDWIRPELCQDALRLGRVLAALMPSEPEVQGLIALMEIQASRLKARVGPGGEPVLLLDQDRSRWDWLLVQRGLAALERAKQLRPLGPYGLQAAIAACHGRARRAEDTNWAQIAALYAQLAERAPSPVVELNRAVAVGMADGPAAGLALVDALVDEPALKRYHLLPNVRGDLLAKLGRADEARAEFERAAALTNNTRERDLLLKRARSIE